MCVARISEVESQPANYGGQRVGYGFGGRHDVVCSHCDIVALLRKPLARSDVCQQHTNVECERSDSDAEQEQGWHELRSFGPCTWNMVGPLIYVVDADLKERNRQRKQRSKSALNHAQYLDSFLRRAIIIASGTLFVRRCVGVWNRYDGSATAL